MGKRGQTALLGHPGCLFRNLPFPTSVSRHLILTGFKFSRWSWAEWRRPCYWVWVCVYACVCVCVCERFHLFQCKINNIRACCSMSHSAQKNCRDTETLTASRNPAKGAGNAGASHCPANMRMRWWGRNRRSVNDLEVTEHNESTRYLHFLNNFSCCPFNTIKFPHESLLGQTGWRFSAAFRALREVKMKRGSALTQQKLKKDDVKAWQHLSNPSAFLPLKALNLSVWAGKARPFKLKREDRLSRLQLYFRLK